MSCQPHRVTSGQSNSGHKQIHISKLFSHIYINFLSSQSTKSITSQTKNIHTQTSDTNFWRVSPFNITPVKRAHKARTCWYRRPFRLIYWYQVKEKYKKEIDRQRNNSTVLIIIDYYGAPSCKSPERLQRQKDKLISSHTHTLSLFHTHYKYTHCWWWVINWYNEKKMTDQYAEERRWVFSFDLKEGSASSSPSWVASGPEILDESSSSSSSLSTLQCPVLSAYFL